MTRRKTLIFFHEVFVYRQFPSTTNPLETVGFWRIFLFCITFLAFDFSCFGPDHINDHRQKKSAPGWGQRVWPILSAAWGRSTDYSAVHFSAVQSSCGPLPATGHTGANTTFYGAGGVRCRTAHRRATRGPQRGAGRPRSWFRRTHLRWAGANHRCANSGSGTRCLLFRPYLSWQVALSAQPGTACR